MRVHITMDEEEKDTEGVEEGADESKEDKESESE